MPADLIKRVDWDLIYPPLTERCFDLAASLRARGHDFYAISGYRSEKEQAKLYFQGRLTPGKIVTKAKPGMSAHNYGLAVDWCKDKDQDRSGLQPDWDLAAYEVLADEAELLGLESAFRWTSFKEGPHVQCPLKVWGISLPDLHQIFRKAQAQGKDERASLRAVWDRLDEVKW